jgi:hypothetical protein
MLVAAFLSDINGGVCRREDRVIRDGSWELVSRLMILRTGEWQSDVKLRLLCELTIANFQATETVRPLPRNTKMKFFGGYTLMEFHGTVL